MIMSPLTSTRHVRNVIGRDNDRCVNGIHGFSDKSGRKSTPNFIEGKIKSSANDCLLPILLGGDRVIFLRVKGKASLLLAVEREVWDV